MAYTNDMGKRLLSYLQSQKSADLQKAIDSIQHIQQGQAVYYINEDGVKPIHEFQSTKPIRPMDERTSLPPDATLSELIAWLSLGVDMYKSGKVSFPRLQDGFITATNVVGKPLTQTALYALKLPKYLEDVLSTTIQNGRNSHNKYDIPPKMLQSNEIIDDYSFEQYNIPATDQSDMGDMNMLGVDYISNSNESRKFSHMNYMLQKLWAMTSTRPENTFNPVERFGANADQFARYLRSNYNDHQINDAHERARADIPKRGRPMGSKNKPKYAPQLERLIEGNKTIINDNPFAFVPPDAPKTIEGTATANVGMSNYVTKPELEETISVVRGEIYSVSSDVDALRAKVIANETRIHALENHKPTLINLQKCPDLPPVELGLAHARMPLLIDTVRSTLRNGTRIIPWVHGPAGTGKTYACEMLEKVFDLPVYIQGKTLGAHEIKGFVNTTGYQSTAFRQAYQHGGIFVADEADSWGMEASTALLTPLGGSRSAFPDDFNVKRHKDFIFVCCANTNGNGANMEYVGRTKQDAAVMNRFAFISWQLDEALEDGMCANKDWLQYVRHVRHRANNSKINPVPMITPRASIFGESLLNTGIEWDTVVEMTLKQGLSDAQWQQIK